MAYPQTVARLTRSESQARTRAHLVATARELFLVDGYAATSLERVAEAAGFSKGAVYSNFTGKNELCTVVLDEIRAEKIAEIADVMSAATTEAKLQRFEEWAEKVVGDVGWTSLEAEFGLQVRRDEHLRGEQSARISGIVALAGAGLTAIADNGDIVLPISPDEAAVALLSLGMGLGVLRAVDPSIPVRGLIDTIRVMAGLPPNSAGPVEV